LRNGTWDKARMPFELHPSFPGPVHGGARIGPHRDRRCSHGHGQSTAQDIGHEARAGHPGAGLRSGVSPYELTVRQSSTRFAPGSSGGQGSRFAAGPAPDQVHRVRPIRRIGCRHVTAVRAPPPATVHPLESLHFGTWFWTR
jgi:hypothetical protein